MNLFPKSAKIPELYSQEHVEDPIVRVKLFSIKGDCRWYLTEYSPIAPDGTPELAFGLCDLFGDGGELGYVSIQELKETLGWALERDMYFDPKPLSEVRELIARNGSA